MAADPANIYSAVTAIVSVGPTSSTAPADATTALAGTFTDVGEIGEDGVEETWDDSSTDIRNNAGAVVRSIISQTSGTLHFTMLETNSTTLEAYYKGSTVTGTGPYTLAIKSPQADRRSWVIDSVDGTVKERFYVPDGEITSRGPITRAASGVKQYEVTLTMYPDATGNIAYIFTPNTALA